MRPGIAVGSACWALLATVGGAAGASAQAPHWSSPSFQINCTLQCHTLHNAPGGQLTASASNVNLCQSCHEPGGLASALAINNADRSVPGLSGTSHAFDVLAVNSTYGAQLPQNTAMALRVMSDNVVCSTCHNQHAALATTGGTPRIAPPSRITSLGSSGTLTSGGTFTGPAGVWYLVEIQTAGNQSTARFRYSKDNGTSWMASDLLAGDGVALDSGVTVSFATGAFNAGERWQLGAAWPFLRAPLDSGDGASLEKLCRDCHRDWAMDHVAAETYTGAVRSHPVGVMLGTNGEGYDRPLPLDANGVAQGGAGADGVRSNDLALDAGGRVQCLTCHGIHHTDGNALTEDLP